MNKETKQALADALTAILAGVALQPQEASVVQNAINLLSGNKPDDTSADA